MKKLLLLLSLAAVASASAQSVEPTEVRQIPLASDIAVNIARISPDGTFAVASSFGDNALYRIDLLSGSVRCIAENGSALELSFSPDSRSITYKSAIVGDNHLRYYSVQSLNLDTDAERILAAPARHAKVVRSDAPSVSINRGHLELTNPDGTSIFLDPQGRGSYLWPEISPDGTRICYFKVGQGCFVCNIDGSNPVSLGYLHGPRWLGNDALVGFEDYDDGEVILSSAIVAVDFDGNRATLTDSDIIAVNPSVSADAKHIIFSSISGELYLITLK